MCLLLQSNPSSVLVFHQAGAFMQQSLDSAGQRTANGSCGHLVERGKKEKQLQSETGAAVEADSKWMVLICGLSPLSRRWNGAGCIFAACVCLFEPGPPASRTSCLPEVPASVVLGEVTPHELVDHVGGERVTSGRRAKGNACGGVAPLRRILCDPFEWGLH